MNKEKTVHPPCSLTGILTRSKKGHNHFRNFSESILFPEITLAAELTWILKFLNIIKTIWVTIFWPLLFNASGENFKIWQNSSFLGSIISAKKALDRQFKWPSA